MSMKHNIRILYAVSGEGFGHITRSSSVISLLKEKGFDVKIVTYNKGLWYIDEFHPDFDAQEIEGFDLYYKNGYLRKYKTFFKFIKQLPGSAYKNLTSLYRIAYEYRPHIIISDFEPFSQLYAKMFKIPLFCIDNIYTVMNGKIKNRKKIDIDKMFTKATIKLFTRRAEYHFLISFAPEYLAIPDCKSYLIPVYPIIRKSITSRYNEKSYDGPVLVYQTSESMTDVLNKITAQNPDTRFAVYGLNIEKRANVTLKAFSHDGFIDDLIKSKAVLTNGGFTLLSEAIYLKKPVYCMPIKGQYEQEFNADNVERAGYGIADFDGNGEQFSDFLRYSGIFRANLEMFGKDDNMVFETMFFNLLYAVYNAHYTALPPMENKLKVPMSK